MTKAKKTKVHEDRVRRLAARTRKEWGGYRLEKSRAHESFGQQGQYMLVDNNDNMVVLGARYDATLADVEAFLTKKEGVA